MPKAPLADPPDWFDDDQRASWHYALEHAPPGMLRALDRSALVVWVVAEDLHAQASQMQQRMGLLVRVGKPPAKDPETGEPVGPDERTLQQSPFLPIINKQAVLMLRAADCLGFTPTARSGVQVADAPPTITMDADAIAAEPLEDFLDHPPPIPGARH
jgi:phage terminase small subunit